MGTCKRLTKERSRLWKLAAKQTRKTRQHFIVPMENIFKDASKRVDDVSTTKKTRRTPSKKNIANDLAQPSSSRLNNGSSRLGNGMVSPQKNMEKHKPASSSMPSNPQKNVGLVPQQKNNGKSMPSLSRPNDDRVSRQMNSGSFPRLNNGKITLQRNIENATSSSLRPDNGLGSPRKYTKKPMPSSSRSNNCVVSSQTNREFSSRSNNVPVSRQKNVKMPQSSSSMPNNGLAYPKEKTKKPKPSSSRPNNGGASASKNIEIPRPSPSRTNNDMIPSSKDIEKSMPSSLSLNGGLVAPPKNIERSMSAKFRPSRLRVEFSSRKPIQIGSNNDSYPTFSISNKSSPSLAQHNSFHAEMSTQVQIEEVWKAKEASNSSSALKGNEVMQGLQSQIAKASCMSNNMEQIAESMRKQNTTLANGGKANDGKSKSKMAQSLLEEKLDSHVDDDSAKENCRPNKRMRKDNEDAGDGDGDQNLVGVESGTAVIIETAAVKDCHTKASPHFVSESWKLPHCSSLPIDQHIWSGVIETCSKHHVSLAAHLSTKYCERVFKLSRSLQPVLRVTKLSRLEAWPKSFETSGPTDDNIALYFFPDKMRQDADLDQLVKEVIENDMVLGAVVDEAELLIFPSVLLPEQYQTFQGKTYLWGVFRPRQEKFAIAEEQHVIGHCAQGEMGKQNASHRGVGKKAHMDVGLNTGVGLEAPEEADEQGMEPEQTPSVARPNTPIPVEDVSRAASAPTMPASMCANNGQLHPSFSVPTGVVLGFVVPQTPIAEHLIEELQREGAVVVAMRGEMIGPGLGQAMAAGLERTPSSS